MSASTVRPRTAVRRGPRLRGLTWLVWRQNRTAFRIALAFAAVVVVFALVRHQQIASAVSTQHLDACRGSAPSLECAHRINTFGQRYQFPMRRPLQLMLLLPFLFGMFLGAPQFAQELESGTYRTVATQSATRMRWFAAKLGVPLGMTVLVSGAVAAAMTWWWQPVAAVMGQRFPWHEWYPFYGVGPVVVGLSVLLYLVGTALGLVLRRTVLAMAATLAVGAGLFALIEAVRPRLWPIHTVNAQHVTEPPVPGDAWQLADGPLSKSGHRVPEAWDCYAGDHVKQCLADRGITGHWAEYHPAADLWPLQWTTTGLCLALGVLVVALSVWWTRRNPA
ncbi:ABC transporter permease [Streptomyces sp. ME03-5709C]|nr:ABC transporter permease [Streptomyces sp. ME03-5709C]